MNLQLISAILGKEWAIDPMVIQSYLPFFDGIMNKDFGNLGIDVKEIKPFAVDQLSTNTVKSRRYNSYNDSPEGSIAVISLNGPLLKSDQYCGPVGMATIGNKIQEADDHRNIGAIIIQIDSPGGTVDGTETLANIIKNTKKPTIGFIDGLAASAGIWIISGTDETIASTEFDKVGSIGVQMKFADLQPAWEKIGVVFHDLKAPESKDKNRIFEEIRAGKYTEYENKVLSPLAQKFHAVIKENRPDVKDEQLTGEVYFAKEVIGSLVDSIGDFSYAVQRASELAEEHKANSSDHDDNATEEKPTEKSNKKNTMKKFDRINAVLGVDNLESTDESISMNEEQMDKIESALPDPNATIPEDKTEELSTATASITAYQEGIDAIDESVANAKTPADKITALTAVVEDLREEPGAQSPKGKKDTDASEDIDGTVASDKKTFVDNLEAIEEEYF